MENLENEGWSSIKYALSFKYKDGSLLAYAIRKEKLLLQVRKTIDVGTLIDMIAVGLPDSVTDRIDREKLASSEDLFREVSGLEHLVNKRQLNEKIKKQENKNPCSICEQLKKGIRYHPEASCWFKNKENEIKRGNLSRSTNSSKLEVEISDKDQKNLM